MTIPRAARIPAAVGKAHVQPTISQKALDEQKNWYAWNAQGKLI